ncbi:MAG: hypothetical protein QGF09_08285, partial [Rhodospirillales bacterium]|nr:hypothetical protein [Rhodospirillales bacterium]
MSEEAGLGKFRKLPPGPGWIVRGLLTSLAVLGGLWALELHHFFATAIFKEQYLALILVIALVATFIGTKARKRGPADHVPWYDWCLAGLSVLTGGHIVIFFPRLVL